VVLPLKKKKPLTHTIIFAIIGQNVMDYITALLNPYCALANVHRSKCNEIAIQRIDLQ